MVFPAHKRGSLQLLVSTNCLLHICAVLFNSDLQGKGIAVEMVVVTCPY